MRWTDENIAKLLRIMCETQNLVINVETISRNWTVEPDSDEKPPSAKGIKEFLAKYKKDLKPGASLTISFSGKESQGTGGSAPAPRKRKAPAGTKSGKKAKASKEPVEDDEE